MPNFFNIIMFLWVFIMEKAHFSRGAQPLLVKFRNFILFFLIIFLIGYSALLTERTFKISRSLILIVKENKAMHLEIVELKAVLDKNQACSTILTITQNNLNTCLRR